MTYSNGYSRWILGFKQRQHAKAHVLRRLARQPTPRLQEHSTRRTGPANRTSRNANKKNDGQRGTYRAAHHNGHRLCSPVAAGLFAPLPRRSWQLPGARCLQTPQSPGQRPCAPTVVSYRRCSMFPDRERRTVNTAHAPASNAHPGACWRCVGAPKLVPIVKTTNGQF